MTLRFGLSLCFFSLSLSCLAVAESHDGALVDAGKGATSALVSELQARLLSSIEREGLVGALDECSLSALTSTQNVAERSRQVSEIKRTSSRVRNPKNLPDEREREALQFFEVNPDASYFLQPAHSGREARMYTPLRIKPLCLACHGEPTSFSQSLLKKLKLLYPRDQAVGYSLGDFRGVIRVSFE